MDEVCIVSFRCLVDLNLMLGTLECAILADGRLLVLLQTHYWYA